MGVYLMRSLRLKISRKERKGLAKDAKYGVLLCVLSVSFAPFAGNRTLCGKQNPAKD